MTETPKVTLPDPQDQPVVTVAIAAQALGMSTWAAYEAVKRGEIPVLRFGRRIVVPTAKLREMLGIDNRDAA